jgi:hypothetical protein
MLRRHTQQPTDGVKRRRLARTALAKGALDEEGGK